jgi:serine/threonine-protein kinase
VICTAFEFVGGSWGTDGRIVFAGGFLNPGLFSVPAEGGAPQPLVLAPKESISLWYYFPQLLPDGTHVLFTIRRGTRTEIAVWSAADGVRQVIADASRARYVAGGHLLYESRGQLRIVSFDPTRLEKHGESTVVVDALARTWDSPAFAVSETGTLAYLPPYQGLSRFVWKDRRGGTTPVAFPARLYSPPPALSHDGRRAVVQVEEGARRNLWIGDVDGEILTRLTDGGDDWLPVFSPDDKWVAFTRNDQGTYNIFRTRADGSGTVEPIAVSPGEPKGMPTFSPDGRVILFNFRRPTHQNHIWQRQLEPAGPLRPFLNTPSVPHEIGAVFSPDGRWVAYQSDATGVTEVYVQPYPAGPKIQISSEGGAWPRWNPRGGELFYEGPASMMAVRMADGRPTGPRVRLFSHVTGEGYDRVHERSRIDYAVSPNGDRFLMAESVESASRPSQIHVIVNGFDSSLIQRSR